MVEVAAVARKEDSMLRQVVNIALLLFICIVLAACGQTEGERIAQVTAIAGSIYATQTASASGSAAPATASTAVLATASTAVPPQTATTAPAATATATAREPSSAMTLPEGAAKALDAAIWQAYLAPDSFTATSLRVLARLQARQPGPLEMESTDLPLSFGGESGAPVLRPLAPAHLRVRGRVDGTDISILNYEGLVLQVEQAGGLGEAEIPRGVTLQRQGGVWVAIGMPASGFQPASALAPLPGETAAALPPGQPTPAPAGGANVAGQVLWDGQPVAGMSVQLLPGSAKNNCSGSAALAETTSDAVGSYYFANVPAPGAYSLYYNGSKNAANLPAYVSVCHGIGELQPGQVLDQAYYIARGDLRIVSPAMGSATGFEPAYTWEAYPGAAYYQVIISSAQDEAGEVVRSETTSAKGTHPLTEGRHRVVVSAYNAQGNWIGHAAGWFTAGAATPRPPAAKPAAPKRPGSSATSSAPGPQGVPFQVVACPAPGVKITAITEARPGWWSIRGTADIPDLAYWKGEISSNGQSWNMLYRSSSPVRDDVLIDFNTGTVPRGAYQIRLTAVDRTGNYPEPCIVQVSTG